MAKDYVQKYLWRDYGQPFHLAWQITLTADEAVAFLAAVCVLITYTQTRTWSLARQTVIRIVRPIQLPDNDDPNSLSRLSQYEAMSRLFSDTLQWRRRSRNPRPASDMRRKISPLFGIASITNATLFIVMGVLVPWLLTGGLATPMVQSRSWDGCRVGEQSGHPTGVYFSTDRLKVQGSIYWAIEKHGQCWRATPGCPSTACDRVSGPVLDRPPINIYPQPDSCPIAEPKCLQRLSEFQVSHENLTLRDYGLNVPFPLRHSRRITCTPLDIKVVVPKVEDDTRRPTPGSNGSLEEQRNPSKNQNLQMAVPEKTDRIRNVTIQSSYKNGQIRTDCINCENLREYFQVNIEDGETLFVVLHEHHQVFALIIYSYYDPGSFSSVIYDATGNLNTTTSVWGGNFSILACREQHRFCLDTSRQICTRYTNRSNALDEIYDALLENGNASTVKELYAFHPLFYKTNTAGPLFMSGRFQPFHPWSELSGAHWTGEVIRWFESALLLTRLNLHEAITGRSEKYVAYSNESEQSGPAGLFFSGKYMERICQSALLLDSHYTNINLFGLVLALFFMTFILIASYWRELKPGARRAVGTVLQALRSTFSSFKQAWRTVHTAWGVLFWSAASFASAAISRVRSSRRRDEEVFDGQGSQIDLATRTS